MTEPAAPAGGEDRMGERFRIVLQPAAECLLALDDCFRGGGA